ncbi:hypothetical protein [Nocardia lasii]|uniref:Uncharacterized protein n=1 Tax=Nocardia lasii TaxID=1616107 RepID=A0ABW1JN87_9NOCA
MGRYSNTILLMGAAAGTGVGLLWASWSPARAAVYGAIWLVVAVVLVVRDYRRPIADPHSD